MTRNTLSLLLVAIVCLTSIQAQQEQAIDHAKDMQDNSKQAKQQKNADNKAAKAAEKASSAKTPSDSPIALAAGVPASVAAAAAIPHPYTPGSDAKSVAKKAGIDVKLADVAEENTKSAAKTDNMKSKSETDIKSAAAIAEQDTKFDAKAADSSVIEANVVLEPSSKAVDAEPADIAPVIDTASDTAPVTAKVDTAHLVADKETVPITNAKPADIASKPVVVVPAANVADLNQPIAKPAVQPVLEATLNQPIAHEEESSKPKSVPAVDHSRNVVAQVPAAVVDSNSVSSVINAAEVPVASVGDTQDTTAAVTAPGAKDKVQATNVVAAPLIPVTTITPPSEPTSTVSIPNTEVSSSPVATSTVVSTTAPATRSNSSSSMPSSITSASSTHSMNRTTTATASSTTTIPPMSSGVSMYDCNTHLLGFALIAFLFMIYQA
ncbi:hypothetical protein INT47_012869 [Mucor saturninus]|uniref:Uncharacterized protein n=1 Tax=Mucor saturninus TaxID=64648 RepID=A0A8H7V1B6_9FUNG|nr:hypothetical protein INT47_012869 [Mucor saturninus]